MKKTSFAILILFIAVSLSGCSSAAKSPEEPVVSVSGEKDRQQAFGKVLWEVYQSGILPDGSELEYQGMESAAQNSFALADVDGDGQEELLLFWGNASMAGMKGIVFGYADGAVYTELEEFPMLTFYNNGYVKAEWSHSQGLEGEFWPYNIYRYDAENDVYQYWGGADAWDKSVGEENLNGEPFPSDIDVDGDGILYYLLPADWNGQYDKYLVDGSDYENWRSAYMSDGEEIEISGRKLTEENISALGCPKPDVIVPQPLG